MKIGITCYPTFGGSGVVATELGSRSRSGGDDVHFISYAMPSRLNVLHERVHFHEVNVTPYPLFDPYPPYTLALATKMAEVAAYEKLDVLHVHYAIPHAISAYLAKQILQSRASAGRHDAARHRHHARRPRRELPADHEIRHRSLGRRHRGLGVAEGGDGDEFQDAEGDRSHPQLRRSGALPSAARARSATCSAPRAARSSSATSRTSVR